MSVAEVGRQLRALRTGSGRTVASVAVEAGLSVPYIANLENGRGNPTMTALSQVASALGMRLAVSLVPADGDGEGWSLGAAQIPPSLVRLGRTARFQETAGLIAGNLGIDHREFTPRLASALAVIASILQRDLGEADWWRLIDALVLIATYPAPSGAPS
jgi:transcriptional regulator with XRE-family HTH domain